LMQFTLWALFLCVLREKSGPLKMDGTCCFEWDLVKCEPLPAVPREFLFTKELRDALGCLLCKVYILKPLSSFKGLS
jgi:hypothetical protein